MQDELKVQFRKNLQCNHGFFLFLQTNDLPSVYRGIKFTCHFTLNEVQERWNALMYEPIISKMAMQAIKNLHPEVVLSVQRKALFSKAEQDVLGTVKANTVILNYEWCIFQKIL
jgi:hypothetical protein